MPSILYFGRGGKDWTQDFPVDPRTPVVFYMLPPIRYPDGNLQTVQMLNPFISIKSIGKKALNMSAMLPKAPLDTSKIHFSPAVVVSM